MLGGTRRRCCTKALLILYEPIDIRLILRAPQCPFVLNEVLPPKNWNHQSFELNLHPLRPGLLEVNTRNRRQDVDPSRGNANLENRVRGLEVLGLHIRKRGPEYRKGLKNSLSVFRASAHPKIHVARRAGMPVRRKGICPDEQILNLRVGEGGQHVAVVGIQHGTALQTRRLL